MRKSTALLAPAPLTLLAASLLLQGCAALFEPIERSLLFRSRPVDRQRYANLLEENPGVEEVRLTTADGTLLHGVLKHAPAAGKGERYPLVIVFGGVARETSWMVNWGDKPAQWGWLMVNYRGYGLSEGRPNEQRLLEDARLIYDWAAARLDVDADNIVLLGRSLGSYVAVSLASQRPVRAAILATPFDSLTAIAERRYPLLPAGWIVNGRYDSVALATKIVVPALFVIADNDEVTPPARGQALARAWGGPNKTLTLSGGHRAVEWRPEYWRAIGEFLGGFTSIATRGSRASPPHSLPQLPATVMESTKIDPQR